MTGDDDALAALEALLADEHAALRQGDFAAIDQLADRKERLIAQLGRARGSASSDRIARLRRAAQRNEALCAAAVEGMRAAMARLSDLARLQTGGGTYDASGRRGGAADSGRLGRRV